ncbi:MAG TPA: TIGR04053 family radical SAM/SPASM domain-containing protein [Candidatus Binatia bacterium]|nr:TIGR04053 family radical SAM/SPASM domain-containing protein [Candidatus Binatia bacterium]
MDFNQRPFTAVWETTRACDLACVHCRAEANPRRSAGELSFAEFQKLVSDIKAFGQPYPLLILTGGDPAKRADIFDVIAYGRGEGLRVAMTPSATRLITRDAVRRFAEAGLVRLAVSLDGKDSASHDAFRGVAGSFERTLQILDWCRDYGLETQIHSTVTRHVLNDLGAIAEIIGARGIKLWALFLLIAVGRAARPELRRLNLNGRQLEALFHWLYDLAKSAPFDVTPREGYHYRRVLLQRRAAELAIPVADLLAKVERQHSTPTDVAPPASATRIVRAPLGVNDGKGILFISHQGDVQPSGFLNLVGGNLRSQTLADIYRDSPVFRRVRDSSELKGKCGQCEFKNICGGSRARAFALTGDIWASDPFCVYQPASWRNRGSTAKRRQQVENDATRLL